MASLDIAIRDNDLITLTNILDSCDDKTRMLWLQGGHIKISVLSGKIKVLTVLLSYHNIFSFVLNEALISTCLIDDLNRYEMFEMIISYPSFAPSGRMITYALNAAVKRGDLTMINRILEYSESKNILVGDFSTIEEAIDHDYENIACLLMSHMDILEGDAWSLNRCLVKACDSSFLNILKMILAHPLADVNYKNNLPLRTSIDNNRYEVVKVLLNFTSPSDIPKLLNNSIASIVSRGYYAMFKLVISYPGVNPAANNNAAIKTAVLERRIEPDSIEIFNELLKDSRVTANLPDNFWCSNVRALRGRAAEICIGLQDMGLPALLTLMILDEHLPNDLPMYKLWNLVTRVKHFRKL